MIDSPLMALVAYGAFLSSAAFGVACALGAWQVSEHRQRKELRKMLQDAEVATKEAAQKLATLHNEVAQQHRGLTEKVSAHEFALKAPRPK